ncbi:MAG: Hpt domain-containing protein [Planctomycetota bacterium]|jgi:HPt (histidine-containing phosphotransfer) domain-containing protein
MEEKIVFDKNKALNIIGGDEEFLREIVEIFLVDVTQQVSEIKKAVESRNREALEKSSHKLKGAVGNFGENATFKTALELETIGKENRMDEAEGIYGILVDDVERLVNALKEIITN